MPISGQGADLQGPIGAIEAGDGDGVGGQLQFALGGDGKCGSRFTAEEIPQGEGVAKNLNDQFAGSPKPSYFYRFRPERTDDY